MTGPDGQPREGRSQGFPAYQRLTGRAEALIAGAYLAGTNNTRRVRRALGALFEGAVGKDTVSRVWHKVQADWEAWQKRSLGNDDIVRLILDGTVVRARLDRKAASLSVLVALGVRRDGQKVLLALRDVIEHLFIRCKRRAPVTEFPAPRPSFSLSSRRAIERYGYAPQDIGPMAERFARELAIRQVSSSG